MTIAEAKNKVLALARSHIGFHEGYNNDNPFAKDPELIKAYGWSPNNLAWCDIFVDYLFCKAFGATLGKQMTYQQSGMSAACKNSSDCYKENWAFFSVPMEGDQAFFYSGGGINHTGIVETVSGSSFTTIEGNTSDAVLRRTYKIGDGTVAGFGRPDWELVVQEEDTEQPTEAAEEKPKEKSYFHLVYGDGLNNPEERVEFLQHGLRLHGAFIDADGEFGFQTEQAVIRFRKACGLGDSGEVDEELWKELIRFEV